MNQMRQDDRRLQPHYTRGDGVLEKRLRGQLLEYGADRSCETCQDHTLVDRPAGGRLEELRRADEERGRDKQEQEVAH